MSNEQWESDVYNEQWRVLDESMQWAELERAEWDKYKVRARLWRIFLVVWILATFGVLILTVALKLYNAIRGA